MSHILHNKFGILTFKNTSFTPHCFITSEGSRILRAVYYLRTPLSRTFEPPRVQAITGHLLIHSWWKRTKTLLFYALHINYLYRFIPLISTMLLLRLKRPPVRLCTPPSGARLCPDRLSWPVAAWWEEPSPLTQRDPHLYPAKDN